MPNRRRSLIALALALSPFAAVDVASAAAPEPHSQLRYYGDASSATGAALGSGSCDVNDDGFDDAVVGAWFWDKAPNSNVGAAYVLFGGEDVAGGDLETPANADAVRIDGPNVNSSFTSFAVACAGDVNDDGIDDIALSYYTQEKAYIVLGAEEFGSIDLGNLGERGYEIRGDATDVLDYNVGFSMAPAGDVNDDGFDDFAIAGVVADTLGRTNNGRVWIVAGKEDVANVNLISPAPGEVLQTIDGPQSEARLGQIAPAGDVNGDGTDDVVLGAYTATPHGAGVAAPGQAWALFGGGSAQVDLANIGNDGFSILGPTRQRDRLGISVAGVGDIDDDGLDDLLIGGDGVSNAATGERDGSAWVVRGADSGETVRTDTTGSGPSVYDCVDDDVSGTCEAGEKASRGYWIVGADTEAGTASEATGYSLSGVGDVNGDTIPDFAIGAYGYDPANPASPATTMTGAGAAFVVFGKDDDATQPLTGLAPSDGYRIDGLAAGDRFGRQVGQLGDVDGNGTSDFAVGGDFAARPLAPGTPRTQAGEVMVGLLGLPLTLTSLVPAPAGSVGAGDAVDLTATVEVPVNGGGTAETGTVSFTSDGAAITGCGAVPVDPADGTATCEDATFDRYGSYSLAASFDGGDDLLDSSSAALEQLVVEDSAVSLEVSKSSLLVDEQVTLSASVEATTSGEPGDSGTVGFEAGGDPIAGCAAVPLTDGTATCDTTFASAGPVQVQAEYSGTPALNAASSEPVELTVTAPEDPPEEPPAGASGRVDAGGPVLRLGGGGRVTLASVTCDLGPCSLSAVPDRLRVGKEWFDVEISVPAAIADGTTIVVRAVLGKDARKALRKKGKGVLWAAIDLTGAGDRAGGRNQFTLKPPAQG